MPDIMVDTRGQHDCNQPSCLPNVLRLLQFATLPAMSQSFLTLLIYRGVRLGTPALGENLNA